MLKTTVREHLLRRDSNNNTCENDVAKRHNALRVSDSSNVLVESRVVESRNERNRGEREREKEALAHAHSRTLNSCTQGRRDAEGRGSRS